MTRKVTVDIVLSLYIFLFVYTAVSKLLEYDKFQVQLAQSQMLTTHAPILASLVPGVELSIAALLVIPLTRLAGLYAAFTLMVMFTAYIIYSAYFSDYVPCSCGGVIEHLSWTQHMVLNIGLGFLAAVAILLYSKPCANAG